MITINARPGDKLVLGHAREELARTVRLDIGGWRLVYGPGTAELLYQRPGETDPYPCVIEQEGDVVMWPITLRETWLSGSTGRYELQYRAGDHRAKSAVGQVIVYESLSEATEEPPEPQQGWVDQVLTAGENAATAAEKAGNAADRAEAATVNAPKLSDNDTWMVWDQEQGQYIDTGVYAGGDAPAIDPETKHWVVGGVDTGVSAEGTPGVGITGIERTGGDGSPGTTDTYTITLSDGSTSTFEVYNGADGAGGGGTVETDATPTSGSTNPVQSGGVYDALAGKMDATDPVGTGSLSLNRKAGTKVGVRSVTEGYNATATGTNSHAEGNGTTASGLGDHAEGKDTTASGGYSHAEGYGTTASGTNSHAEGKTTTASGTNSHAEGGGTKATGEASHAEGYNACAHGKFAHAEGCGAAATKKSQHVQGEYNVLDTEGTTTTRGKYAHIVGNGTSESKRSNAHTLDWEGNAWFEGDVYVGSKSGTSQDEGSKKLATVDDLAAAKYQLGHGLKLDEEDKLTVDSVSDFDGDNTLPATAALVQSAVGNIETLLSTI